MDQALNKNINDYWNQTIKTTGRKALTQDGVTYDELAELRRKEAVKRYGNRVINDLIGFSKGDSNLQVDDIVRLLRHQSGKSVGSVTWNTDSKTSANNWTRQKYRVVKVHPGGGMRREVYSIAALDTPNTIKAGRFSREQLLKVPGTYFAQTPTPESEDEDDDDDDDDDEDEEVQPPAPPVYPRPQKPSQQHRYSVGDVLRISRPLSNAVPGNVAYRDGTVTALQFFNDNGTQLATYRIRFTLANGQTRTDLPS